VVLRSAVGADVSVATAVVTTKSDVRKLSV
jgi:hypothetical protein